MRRTSHSVSRLLLPVALLVCCVGCGSDSSSPTVAAGEPTSSSVSSASTSDATATPPPPIVGRWAQAHACPAMVRAFRSAGLGDMAPYEAAVFGPDRPDSEMPSRHQVMMRARELRASGDLCAGAHAPFRHFHFFSAEGLFGSLDEHLQQVDDGTYETSGDKLVMGDATFRYHVTHGDTLTLEPLLTPTQRHQALAHPLDFTTGSWMVSVAYAGTTWTRVPCREWC
jgi:hypothetical protein